MNRRPLSHRTVTRRSALGLLLGGSLGAVGCAGDGHFSILGYTTRPNYDPEIRSVYVPVFKTKVLQTGPFRGIEFQLTRAVIDRIEKDTPFKVISDPDRADSELQGTIKNITKTVINRTPFNDSRESELVMVVEIVWHDLRPGYEGKVLSNPQRKPDRTAVVDEPFDPAVLPAAKGPDRPNPILVVATGRLVPEAGESTTTGIHLAVQSMAKKIVHGMERPWDLPNPGE